MAVMNFDEKEVAKPITDPHTIIALSDAGAHASQLCDACYSTYLLVTCARRKTFSIGQAVHNLTQRPAEMFSSPIRPAGRGLASRTLCSIPRRSGRPASGSTTCRRAPTGWSPRRAASTP